MAGAYALGGAHRRDGAGRTDIRLDAGWSLEAATFVAAAAEQASSCASWAFVLTCKAMRWPSPAASRCARRFRGADDFWPFRPTSPHSADRSAEATTVVEFLLRVSFTVGAIGAGLAIVGHILKSDDF